VTATRWEGDEVGAGVGDASAFAGPVEGLLDAMRHERWVTEDPELHLLPHIKRGCDGLPLELRSASVAEDGCFDVELDWTGETSRVGEIRAAVFTLVGTFAELSSFVRQLPRAGRFEVVTGFVGEEGRFAPHGHTVRLTVHTA
jgi:hypothetical protein